MRTSTEGDIVLAKLDDGEDLFPAIRGIATHHGFDSGMVLWGIGMLRDAEVGFFNGTSYERETYREPQELLAMHGSIAADAEVPLHLHVALAGRDHRVVGGHLFRARVAVLNEIAIRPFREIRLTRALNPRSGLRELVLEPPGRGGPRGRQRAKRGTSRPRRTSGRRSSP